MQWLASGCSCDPSSHWSLHAWTGAIATSMVDFCARMLKRISVYDSSSGKFVEGLMRNTVDGRNPANQLISSKKSTFIPLFLRLYTFQVVQDFFHQQNHASSENIGVDWNGMACSSKFDIKPRLGWIHEVKPRCAMELWIGKCKLRCGQGFGVYKSRGYMMFTEVVLDSSMACVGSLRVFCKRASGRKP